MGGAGGRVMIGEKTKRRQNGKRQQIDSSGWIETDAMMDDDGSAWTQT